MTAPLTSDQYEELEKLLRRLATQLRKQGAPRTIIDRVKDVQLSIDYSKERH